MNLQRRHFLQTAAAAASCALGSLPAFAMRRKAWSKPIGVQLYTERDLYAKDPLGTLWKLAHMGFGQVELINVGSIPAPQLKNDLKKTGLKAIGGHFAYAQDDATWRKQIDLCKQYELEYLICPFSMANDRDGWLRIAENFNHGAQLARQAGVKFGYHNHLQEFRPLHDNGGPEKNGYDILLNHTDPHLVDFEMDVFWITWAEADPLHYFRSHPGRFKLLHIKDLRPGLQARNPREFPPKGPAPFVPVGQGEIVWDCIFAHTAEAGANYIFVEQDNQPTLPELASSARFLRTLYID